MATEVLPLDQDEKNTVRYITAPTLPELETRVNEAVHKHESMNANDANLRFGVDFYKEVQFLNGEYVQTAVFNCYRMRLRPIPRKKTEPVSQLNS